MEYEVILERPANKERDYRLALIRSRYSVYLLLGFFALDSGVFVVFLSLLLRLVGIPTALLTLAALIISFGLPYSFSRRLYAAWNRDEKVFSETHPSKYLARIHGLGISTTITELACVAAAILLVNVARTNNLPIGESLPLVAVEFAVIELVTLVVMIRFWQPDPNYALLASLASEEDYEKGHNTHWLDVSIDYFNATLKSKELPVRLRRDLNLEVLLFDSHLRRLFVAGLYDAAESGDHRQFIRDVAQLAGKRDKEILERNSLAWQVKMHSNEILIGVVTLIGVLITLAPFLNSILDAIVKAWSSLL